MDTSELIGLIIGGVAVVGGLAVGAVAVAVTIPWSAREKIAKLEIRNKERMAMIEKGVDPAIIFREPRHTGQNPLLWGLLLAGMGLGILLGFLLSMVTGWDRSVLINAMAILFGGLGLVVFSSFIKRSETRNAA